MFDTYSFFVGYLSDTAVNEDHHTLSAFTNRCGMLYVFISWSVLMRRRYFFTSQ